MNTPFSVLKISALVTTTLLLSACIDDDNDSSEHPHDSHEDHAHSLMITQASTDALSVLEEGEPESLSETAAANAATLLLSNTGEQAAIVTAATAQFVMAHHEEEHHDEEESEDAHEEEEGHDEEEHELPEVSSLSISGSNIKVANSNGHFSVLANGKTQFVPYEALEEESPEAEEVSYTVAEDYPALLLHEDPTHGMLTLVFDGTTATVYDADEKITTRSVACDVLNSTAHVGEFAVVSCDNATFSVKVVENGGEHEAQITPIAGISTAVEWKSRAGVFVGLGADDKFYILEENAQEALALVESESEGTGFAAPADMCTWGIDSLDADIFALTATALSVHDHEGAQQVSLTLDETANATCADLTMATATQAVFVLDNSASKLYEIDKEEGAALYHIHGREDLSVNDVASAISFHEVGEDADHDHSHD